MKVLPDIWHLEASEAQLSPEMTWIVVQEPRRAIPSDRAALIVIIVELVLLDPSSFKLVLLEIGNKGGAVTKVGPVILLVSENPSRHSAFDHNCMALCTAAKVPLMATMTPKTWSASLPEPQSCIAKPPEMPIVEMVAAKFFRATSPIPSFCNALPM